MKMWRVLFFFCGGIALVGVICWKFLKDVRSIMPEREFKGSGLGGLLARYQTEKNTLRTVIFAPVLFLICLYFTRGGLSFAACLSVLIGGLWLIIGSFGQKQKMITNFRELGLNLAVSGSKDGDPVLLETLDGEVRSGEIIAYAAHVYYLYPSALILARLSLVPMSLAPTPLIIPTKDIASVTHKITHHIDHHNAISSPGRPYDLFTVCVYGRQEEKLGEVVCHENSDAQFLIKALNRKFGVVNLDIVSPP
ncbi:MAG: hypothetical protein LBP21_05090 [Synergistaceae bacterium]|jgi:hypothetical protein|nr:hypothetical protein [Synergistaceae bacterium]